MALDGTTPAELLKIVDGRRKLETYLRHLTMEPGMTVNGAARSDVCAFDFSQGRENL
jgi:hypothetical protein